MVPDFIVRDSGEDDCSPSMVTQMADGADADEDDW